MENQHTVNGLVRKRAELAGQINALQGQLVGLLSDLSAIDSAIRIFDPTIELEEIVMKPVPPRNGAARGQMTLLALNILREAGKPLSTEEISERIMAARGLSTADKPLVRMMLQRVHSCLRAHRKRGRVRSAKTADGKRSVWELV